MIKLTKINDEKFYLNSDLIEFLESTPDTIISLTTGKKVIVRETVNEVVEKIISFRSKILRNWEFLSSDKK